MKTKTMAILFNANYREFEYGKIYDLPVREASELIATGHARTAQPNQATSAAETEAEAENEHQAQMVPVDR